ncbi:substrate-binding domain-containing protein [Citricoccus sp. NPDC055426]|uniref:sugar ABC transporter substrate-binding protein n=1 Tax=Citricoccus sp. NPDC055426 TaxID=3155536 RepID=UPI003422A3CA
MRHVLRSPRLLIASVGLSAAALTFTACSAPAGDSVPAGSASESSASSPAADAQSPEASAGDASAELTAYEGIVGAPPTESVAVPEDVSAWVVSCGQSQATCSTPAQGAADAAEVIGWESNICDGQLNPNGWSACIRQGVAADADVILVIGQDCSSFQGPLQEAKDAGIMTIGVGANDCDIDGGEPLYSGTTTDFADMTSEQWWNTMGELQAAWLIEQTEGNVKLLDVKFEDTRFGPWMNAGLHAGLEDCEACEVVASVNLGNQDAASGQLAPKLSSALVQAPDVNAIAIPIDGWFMAGLSQGIESSGRSDELSVIGAFGQQANLELIAAGQGQDATVAFSMEWNGWSGIDTALRLMADQDIQPAGVGMQVVDAEHNMPADGEAFAYNPEVDFTSAYQEVWGK